MDEFKLHFNKKKQWVDVFLWEVHPNTFQNWKAGRWGYFESGWSNPCSGYFGALHFVRSRLRIDTISHELDHMRAEWIWANRQAWTGRSEERLTEFKDLTLWRFIRELSKFEPKARIWMRTLSEL